METDTSAGPSQVSGAYSNINSVMPPVVMQAKTVTCTFHDGGKTFSLKGSNAYNNASMRVNGVPSE